MVDTIKETSVYPVNELGEILVQTGVGSPDVAGYISSALVPTDPSSDKMVIKMPSNVATYTTDSNGNPAFVGPDGEIIYSTPPGVITSIIRNTSNQITSYTEDGITYNITYDSSGRVQTVLKV